MFRIIRIICCLVLAGLCLSACHAPHKSSPHAKEESPFLQIGRIAPNGIFSPGPKAEIVAFERAGLHLLSLASGTEQQLSEVKPLALDWSVEGQRLATAFAEDGQSRLVIYSADGQEVASSSVTGRITQLAWTPDDELLALSVQLQPYSFGVALKAEMLSWAWPGPIESEALFDTTLKKRTLAEFGEELYRLIQFELSPLGDEIAYTRLYDPPVIRKSIKVIHRHLKAGTEHLVYDLPLETGGVFWSFDSETLLMSNGSSMSFLYDPWQNTMLWSWPLKGQHLAHSPVEDLLYIDGSLYRDNLEVAHYRSGRAAFSQDGRCLLVADGQELFLHALPMSDSSEREAQGKKERLLLLRELRSKNLLTVEEYLQAREDLLQ